MTTTPAAPAAAPARPPATTDRTPGGPDAGSMGTPGARSPRASDGGSGGAPGEAAAGGWRRVVRLAGRCWPALLGLAIGVLSLTDIAPWEPSEPTTPLIAGLAVAYLVFGAVRHRYRRPGVLRLQLVGLAIFGGCTLAALLVDPSIGKNVAAAGWIGHAAWDVLHHRDLSRHDAVGVVPRGYAEFCIVLDLLTGAALLAAPVA